MKCPECGVEINDNEVYCPKCGAEIILGDMTDDIRQEDTQDIGDTKKQKRNNKDKKGKNRLIIVLRIVGAAVVIALIIILIVYIVGVTKSAAGRKVFDGVPLGRDIEYVSTQTGVEFLSGESSEYGAVNYIADYDYICESEKSVTVDGIMLPEWAVLLRENSAGSVDEAVLYNFGRLKHSWMGSRTAEKLETASVEYGMTIKSAERALGLKPYTIVKESMENTSIYVYRYHYTDDESGNNCVRNFYVEISDVDGKVKNVYDEQLDYLNLILQAESD